MKKIIALMCACLTIVMAGCSAKKDDNEASSQSSDTTTTQQSANNTPPKEEITINEIFDASKSAMGEIPRTVSLDKEVFAELYGDIDKVEEFICEIPAMNVHATEICVVRFKENVTEEQAEEFFEERQKSLIKTWEEYLPEQYEIVKDYKVAVNGPYALYCIGENADDAEDAFESFKG